MGLPHPKFAAIEVSIAGNQLDVLQYRVHAVVCCRTGNEGPSASTTVRDGPAPAYGARVRQPGASSAWSAAVRALRERTLAEIETQRLRFVTLTGRDWQLADVAFDDPALLSGDGDTELRVALAARVVLRSSAPTWH